MTKTTRQGTNICAAVYHGTDANFDSFDVRWLGSANGTAPINRAGFNFTDDPVVASTFGNRVVKASVVINRPYIIDAMGQGYSAFKDTLNETLENVDRTRYDGIVIKNYADVGIYGDDEVASTHYIPFDCDQVTIIDHQTKF